MKPRAKEKVRGTIAQHQQLDAYYKRILDRLAASTFWFYKFTTIMELWRQEKIYLSKYGERYPHMVNTNAVSLAREEKKVKCCTCHPGPVYYEGPKCPCCALLIEYERRTVARADAAKDFLELTKEMMP